MKTLLAGKCMEAQNHNKTEEAAAADVAMKLSE